MGLGRLFCCGTPAAPPTRGGGAGHHGAPPAGRQPKASDIMDALAAAQAGGAKPGSPEACSPMPAAPQTLRPIHVTEPAADSGQKEIEQALTDVARRLTGDGALDVVLLDGPWAYSPKRHLLVMPKELRSFYGVEALKGALCREVGRWIYSRGPADFRQPSHAFCLLWHSVDQVRTNALMQARAPEALPWLKVFYEESLERLRKDRPIDPMAEAFVRYLIHVLMFDRPLEAPSAVQEAFDACAATLRATTALPSERDVTALSDACIGELSDATFRAVHEHVWPIYEKLLAQDVDALVGGANAKEEVICPAYESAWPWNLASPGPLAYDPAGQRVVEQAKQRLRDNIRLWALQERTPALEHLSVVAGPVDTQVTWEQAMRRKPLQSAVDVDQEALQEHLQLLHQRVEIADAMAFGAGDPSDYARIRREELATIRALCTAINAATSHKSRRQKQKYFTSGTYESRRGLLAQLEERASGVRNERVFSRRRQVPQPKPPEFVFAIDISGSMMGANIEAARRAFVVFQEALLALKIPAGSFAFHSEVIPMNPIGLPTTEARRVAFDKLQAGGGNNEPTALQAARALFAGSRAKQRILLFLTDGGAAANTPQEVAKLQKETGMHVIGIGIGSGCGQVTQMYPQHLVVTQVSDLPQRMGMLLQDMLQGHARRPAVEANACAPA